MLPLEHPLRLDEEPGALPGLRHGGVTSGLHGEQPSLKLGVWRMSTQCLTAALREGNGGLRLAPMVGEVAHAGQDVGAELDIVAQLDERKGAVEVLGCDCVGRHRAPSSQPSRSGPLLP